MIDLSLENIEFIKILANSDSSILQKSMDTATKDRFHSQIGIILREYYKENTIGKPTGWIEKFENAGISEDDGKAAIACARRLGLEIY
ncbi:MAG: hypothetical protein IIA19_02610 [Thaumarchaeota archaeon]|nr:hypothetical protein [Nitrososphaerota archaeon]